MTPLTGNLWIPASVLVVVVLAVFTDLRSRRIPNWITIPGMIVGLGIHFIVGGWVGLGLSVCGLLLAPSVLSLTHAGKGLGMGDIKLAAALGAILGPPMGALAMLVSAVCGGFLAVAYIMKEFGFFRIGRASEGGSEEDDDKQPIGKMTIPFGLALGMGTVITLVLGWWTGAEQWFL